MSAHDAAPDWHARYASGDTPWDVGAAHPELARRLAAGELVAPGAAPSVYVPGCGRGHDARALAAAGARVWAVDLVPDLGAELGPALAAGGGGFEEGDALAYEGGPFDLLFEHTFFCAIDPGRRTAYGAMARRLLRPGGVLVALVSPIGRPVDAGGPPWGIATEDLQRALGEAFVLELDEPAAAPVAGRPWAERWAQFRRA